MPNLLILSYFFPPSNDIAARRFGTMAGYLDKSGFKVNVLTTHSQGSLPLEIAEEQVIRIGYNRQKSASVDDLAAEKLPFLIDSFRRPLRQRGYYLWSVDRTVSTWYREIKANLAYIDSRIEKPDLIIGSFGPSACLWGARFLAEYYHTPWIADIRDLGALRVDERSHLAKLIDVKIEKRLLASASGLTTVSPSLKKILIKNYPLPVQTVYNGWDQILNQIAGNDSLENSKYIYYAGSFHPEQIPSMLLLLDCLADFPAVNLVIRSLGPHDLNLQIIKYAADLGLSRRVLLLPPCDHDIVNREIRQSWVNLVLNDLSVNDDWTKGTLTGKLFELLVHKAPILAIGRPDGDMGQVIRQTGKGSLCSTRLEITAFLNWVTLAPSCYAGGSRQIKEFSREQQAAKMGSFVRQFVPYRKGTGNE